MVLLRRFLPAVLLCGLTSVTLAQEEKVSPEAPALTPAPAAESKEATEAENKARVEAVKAELLALEAKAKEGDLKAALELANKLVAFRNAAAAVPFYRQAAKGDVVEAQEKIALILLNTAERATWPEGHSWLDRAAQGGSVRAIEEQARMVLFGSHGREKSVAEAQKLLEKARGMPGAREAHFLLGKMAAEGIGRERDGAVAVDHLRRGEAAGSIDAMLGLVDLFVSDSLVKKDLAEAERLARKAYDLGSAEAAYRLAIMFERADPKVPDFTGAREWLGVARERGHSGAMARLGTYALQGNGEIKDPTKAYRHYREAAARGHADAAYAIAKLYDQGQGAPQDPVAAAAWYRIAAEGGQAQAQNEYGVRLAAGRGVPADVQGAAGWFQRACKRNLPAAFVNLGELYLVGNGLEKDEPRAHNLFESAAKAGHPGAQERLSRLCEMGIGLGGVADPVGAAYWAARAAENNEKFVEGAKKLREVLKPDQVGELERRLEAARRKREQKPEPEEPRSK